MKFAIVALLAGIMALPVYSQEEPVSPAPENTTVPETPEVQEAPVVVDRESGEDYEKRVKREVKEMDKQIHQLKKRQGDFSAEQKGALTTYEERRKVVYERLRTVDSADSAQVQTAKGSVNASLVQLQDAYNTLVDMFEIR